MNQILYLKNKKYIIIFWFFFILAIFFIILYFTIKYNNYKKENFSKSLVSSYEIMTLYNNSENYTANKTLSLKDENDPFVIGLINIDKLNLSYPILSSTNEDLLKISPCRFYGPMPNTVGNLCIAGHNNADNTIFGKLYLLDIGDNIDIYDLNGNMVSYIIYNQIEVASDDLSCLDQNTNGMCEITLITCNTIKGTRQIIKAKENR